MSETAVNLFNQTKVRAEAGDEGAELVMGINYSQGCGVTANAEMAYTWWLRAAEKGLHAAQWRVGLCLSEGKGVARDLKAAEQWLLKSAKQSEKGQLALGMFYYGIPEMADLDKAIYWLEKSKTSEWGPSSSGVDDYMIGLCYEGKTPKNITKAAEHYAIAANKNHPGAQSRLGLFHVKGDGVPKDYAKALDYLRASTAVPCSAPEWKVQPDYQRATSEAWLNLGLCYSNGLGVTKDLHEAAKCFLQAAALGEPNAMWALGIYHEFGRGVPKDTALAYAFYNLAGTKLPKAADDLAKLESKMTPDEIAVGQSRTKQLAADLTKMSLEFGGPLPGR